MSTKKIVSNIPPQKDILSLTDAEDRTRYWREAVQPIFPNQEVPHGFYIPLADIQQLATDFAAEDIIGVRVYFTYKSPRLPGEPLSNEVEGILVPVKQEMSILPPAIPVYRDIIIPVLQDPIGQPIVHNPVSIYDVTQPCPPCCDDLSPLLGATSRKKRK